MSNDIGHVSYWTEMYSKVAQLESLKVRVLGMEAFNRQRVAHGYTEGYNEDEFERIAGDMEKLAEELLWKG